MASPVVSTIWITYCNLNILFVTIIGNFFILSCFSVYLLCFVMCFNCFLEEAKCDTYFENSWKERYKRKNSHIWTLDLIQIYFDKYSLFFDVGVVTDVATPFRFIKVLTLQNVWYKITSLQIRILTTMRTPFH